MRINPTFLLPSGVYEWDADKSVLSARSTEPCTATVEDDELLNRLQDLMAQRRGALTHWRTLADLYTEGLEKIIQTLEEGRAQNNAQKRLYQQPDMSVAAGLLEED